MEVSRTTQGYYWVHAVAYKGQRIPDAKGMVQMNGCVIEARIDRPGGVESIPDCANISHLAVLIKTEEAS